MAISMEQPLKKRKLEEAPPPPHPLSQEETARRRRNKEEIKNLYECYKMIRFCVSAKSQGARLMPDFEQSYLSLITASRGCTSVQRIVSELIPRYASYCPTALEAAAKVSVNLHNWNFALIMRGEDADGVAYQTAKACIFGLVDICLTAASEAPTSSVIKGICSAVFMDVLTFFTSTLDGQDIYQLTNREITKLVGTEDVFSGLKDEQESSDASPLAKLFKFRAISLLRVFFSCSKSLLAACFELFAQSTPDNGNQRRADYFMNQLTSSLNVDDEKVFIGEGSDRKKMDTIFDMASCESMENDEIKGMPNEKKSDLNNKCLLNMALKREAALRSWILVKYKKLSILLGSEVISGLTSSLEKVVGPLSELMQNVDVDLENNDKSFGSSRFADHQSQTQNRSEGYGKVATSLQTDCSSRTPVPSLHFANNISDKVANVGSLSLSHGIDSQLGQAVDENEDAEVMMPILRSPAHKKSEDLFQEDSSKQNLALDQTQSVFEENIVSNLLKKHILSPDSKAHTFIESAGRFSSDAALREQSSLCEDFVSLSSQTIWYTDGDLSAMHVFTASNLLWVSSFGNGTSETSIRLLFEDFGPLERYLFFSAKNFALVEYCNIVDAVKAREYVHGSSPWGSSINVKFLDIGLGTRGIKNGIVVGNSCYVYVGNLYGQRAKDEIFCWLDSVGARIPHVVLDLTRKGALLLEFPSSEEAALAMTHIRQKRRESEERQRLAMYSHRDTKSSCCRILVRHIDSSVSDEELISAFCGCGKLSHWEFKKQSGCCLIYYCSYEGAEQAKLHLDGVKFGLTKIRVEIMTDSLRTITGNLNLIGSVENKVGNSTSMSLSSMPEIIDEFASPAMNLEALGCRTQSAQLFQSTWHANNGAVTSGPAHIKEGHAVPLSTETVWQYKKPELEPPKVPAGGLQYVPPVSIPIPVVHPPVKSSSFITPIGTGSHSSWSGFNSSVPLNPISAGMAPSSGVHPTMCAPLPFIPSSITPLAQFMGNGVQFGQETGNLSQSPPPPPDEPPPTPPPPPMPLSQPPLVPPLPGSPVVHLKSQNSEAQANHKWQGTLCKSGVQYCNVYADREESMNCKYSDAVSEPVDWPAKLDVTKRTDVRHVITTFNGTSTHKREVCRLIPSSEGDLKGIHDFISYLKQRECAGVIKVPTGKCKRSRLLFIVPCTPEFCSLFSVAPYPSESLLALALPKDTTLERA